MLKKEDRVIFCVESVYQLLNAIIIKEQYYSNVISDIMLSDITDFGDIYYQLKEQNIFDSVIKVDTELFENDFWLLSEEEKKQVFLNPIDNLPKEITAKYYTDIFIPIDHIFWMLFYYGQVASKVYPKIHFFEDGIRSYTANFAKTINKREFLNLGEYDCNTIIKNVKSYYLYEPRLYQHNLFKNILKPINRDINETLRGKIMKVFGFEKLPSQKYIFFEESYFGDNYITNDFEILKQIAEYVGKDNIIVKRHPRNLIDRFSCKGFNIMNSIKVPWEVQLLFNKDIEDKVLISFMSTAAITPYIILGKKPSTILLKNMLKGNVKIKSDEGFSKYFDELYELWNEKEISLYYPTTLSEVQEITNYLHKI